MSDVSEHSEFDYPKKKERKKKKIGKERWSYNKILIHCARSGWTGKYLALGHGARSVRIHHDLGPPTQSISTYYQLLVAHLLIFATFQPPVYEFLIIFTLFSLHFCKAYCKRPYFHFTISHRSPPLSSRYSQFSINCGILRVIFSV